MDDLKSIAKAQEKQKERPVCGYKIYAVVCVGLVFYLAYCCVHQEFKILTFANEYAYLILRFFNKGIMFLSQLVFELLQLFG